MSKDHDREVTRRALIKWGLAAGAALGVSRARILDVFERSAGRGVAEAAATAPAKRSVHVRAGNGGLAWFTLMWPHNDIAAANNQRFAWPFTPQQTRTVAGSGGMLTLGPATPFAAFEREQQVTALMAGSNEAHTNNPDSIVRSVGGNSLFAIASVVQAGNPSVVPVITVDDVAFGSAPGAPLPSKVPTGDDIVGLFNSAASRAGGLLATTQHADLYRAHYTTLAGLNRAANLSTTRIPYSTGRSAARFLGTNLADKLAITPADLTAYGITTATQPDVAAIGRTLIVTAKAFQMGLTSSVILPGLRDDPHPAFTNIATLTSTVTALGKLFDAFHADLAARTDSVTGKKLSDDVVITVEGDTPKTPLERVNWLDDTPGNSNWVYVFGGGRLKTGWFGSIDRSSAVRGFDPATGAATTNDGDLQAQAAVGAIVYALTGDRRRVQDFTQLDISGLVV